MLSLSRILISDLVVTNLFMQSLIVIILFHLATPSFIPTVFLHEIRILCIYCHVDYRNMKKAELNLNNPAYNLSIISDISSKSKQGMQIRYTYLVHMKYTVSVTGSSIY